MKSKLSSRFLPALGAALLIVGVAQVTAHGEATGVVKERMDFMSGFGDNMKPMGAMFKGEADYDLEAVKEHAAFIADNAPKLTEFFPEGSIQDSSEALPVIWEQWDDFQAKATALAENSAALVETANSGAEQGEVRAAFARLGKSCGNCHEVYREKKE